MTTVQAGLPGLDDIAAYLAQAVDVQPPRDPVPPIGRLVDELTRLGLRPGEVVVIAVPNSRAMLACFFAVLFAGGVPAPITAGTPPERARQLAAQLGGRFMLVLHSAAGRKSDQRVATGTGVDAVIVGHEIRRLANDHVVLTTSGTSGAFSGCLHRFSSLMTNARRHAAAVGLTSSDVVLVTLPLNYSYALVAQALAAFTSGSRLVIAGPPFSPDSFGATIHAQQVTATSLTPYMARPLVVSTDWSAERLRMMTVGGDALDARITSELRSLAPDLELYLTYGLTEAGPRVSTLAAHREPSYRWSSVGRPLPQVEVALRDQNDDGTGELLVKTDTAMVGRVGVEDGNATRGLLGPGQVATGDVFRIDGDGYLYFIGRRSEFLVCRGTKVFLPSVRRIANEVPGVISSSTRGLGDRYLLNVYARDHAEQQQRIKRAVLQRLLRAEWPEEIRVLPADQLTHK